jgi:hypothetical protein
MPPLEPGAYYKNRDVSHTAQGDIYADVPFVFAHSTASVAPVGARKRPADEPEVIIPDPVVGPGLVCSYTCGFTAQPAGTKGYAHPYRLVAPIVSAQTLADHGVKANELRKLIESGFLQGLLYLPVTKRVAPTEPEIVNEEWKGHAAALLYRPTLVHQGLLDNRERLTRLTGSPYNRSDGAARRPGAAGASDFPKLSHWFSLNRQSRTYLQIPLIWSGICCDKGDIVCRRFRGTVGDRVARESRIGARSQSQASRRSQTGPARVVPSGGAVSRRIS